MRAHLATIQPYVRGLLRPPRPPRARHWRTELVDPDVGRVRLSGELRHRAGSEDLVLLVHGLGSSAKALHCRLGAARFAALGSSTLALSLRGADPRSDGGGDDFYNVALTADLQAALASPELACYRRLWVVGYSMGGYAALHLACEAADPRLRGVAAVCTPLDLSAAQRAIDAPRAAFYRRRVLRGLIAIYERVARRRAVPTDVRRVRRVRTIHAWDRLTIAPRYGYASPEHYYRELAVVPRLPAARVPVWLLAARDDPVVPPRTIAPFLDELGPLRVRWFERAGHLAFPSDLGPLGVEGCIHDRFCSVVEDARAGPVPGLQREPRAGARGPLAE